MDYYTLHIAGLTRRLPRVRVNPRLEIASFVMLGDTQLVEAVAHELYNDAHFPREEVEILVCPEAKAIPLTHAIARLAGVDYVVARKSEKPYMHDPISEPVTSITTSTPQSLVLDGTDAKAIRGKAVCIVDDVVSTGGSLQAMSTLLERIDARVVGTAAALLEEGGHDGSDLIFLERLPVFPI